MKRSQGASGSPQLQQQRLQLQSIKGVWKQYGQRMKTWWSRLDQDKRLEFLLEWCPYMPLSRDKPYVYVDGKKEDVSGASMLAPEWNQEDLVQGNCLIGLLQEIAEVPDIFEELCWANIDTAQTLVGKVKSRLPPKDQKHGIVMVVDGPQFGQAFQVAKMVPEVKAWLDKGMAVKATVFEAVMLRVNVLLGSAAMCLDHFGVEVLGKGKYKAVGPQMGCAQCGAAERKGSEGGRLLTCSACGIAFYCSRECQKAHWREHKPDCRPQQQQTASSSKAAEAAPSGSTTADSSGAAVAAADSSKAAAVSEGAAEPAAAGTEQ